MKNLVFACLLVVQFSANASALYKLKSIFNSFFGDQEEVINMPEIPKASEMTRAAKGYEQKTKNNIKFKEEDALKYNYSFVKELFASIRKQEPTKSEMRQWMNVLTQSGSREGVYRALVLDSVYLGLENYDFTISDKNVSFALNFMQIFLERSMKRENLEKLNFYTVKRSITEKALELMDELFKRDNEDIYDWYALFSADVAGKYPKVWVNKTRKNTSPRAHKEWAKNVPDQYIKSEVIIKIHKVFNYLQDR